MADSKKQKWTNLEILEVAKRHRQIVWMIFLGIIALYIANRIGEYFPGAVQTYLTFQLVACITGIIQFYFIYKLAMAIRFSTPWLYIVLSFIPVVNLFSLLYLSWRAIVLLKTNGIQMGIMGAKSSSMDQLKTKN